ATVEQLARPAGRARRQVPGLHQGHTQAPGGGVQRGARADHAATDDQDVELFLAQPPPVLCSLVDSQSPRGCGGSRRVHAFTVPSSSGNIPCETGRVPASSNIDMTRARWSTVATALLAALVVSGCHTPGTPAPTPPQPTTSTSTPAPPRDATNPVDVTFEDVTFTLRIPGYFGDGSREADDPECAAHRDTWGKPDKASTWKRLSVAMVPAGGQASPDREADNRRYPAWTSSELLPERTQRVATPA